MNAVTATVAGAPVALRPIYPEADPQTPSEKDLAYSLFHNWVMKQQQVADALVAGQDISDVAQATGYTTPHVRMIARVIGWRPGWRPFASHSSRQAGSLSWEEIVRLRTEDSITLEEIGQRAGITRERVRQVLAYHGVTGFADGRSKRSFEFAVKLSDLWATGATIKEIARDLGKTPQYIGSRVVRFRELYPEMFPRRNREYSRRTAA